MIRLYSIILTLVVFNSSVSQVNSGNEIIELGKTKEEFIEQNHIEDIEQLIHKFTSTEMFINFLLKEGHNIDPGTVSFSKKDIEVGEDLDIYVKHFTEHQNFTMILIPISLYNLAIYDTLLFAVVEVSDTWLKHKYLHRNIEDPEEKSKILAQENHNFLTNHVYAQAMAHMSEEISEVQVNLHESYITTSHIQLNVRDLSKEEKKEFRENWNLLKKAFTHNVDLNVEMNVYIFGYDDMDVTYTVDDRKKIYQISPSNIFTRHHFSDEGK